MTLKKLGKSLDNLICVQLSVTRKELPKVSLCSFCRLAQQVKMHPADSDISLQQVVVRQSKAGAVCFFIISLLAQS